MRGLFISCCIGALVLEVLKKCRVYHSESIGGRIGLAIWDRVFLCQVH